MMAREKKGDSIEGEKETHSEKRECVHPRDALQQRGERKKKQWQETGRSNRGESACTLGMCCNKLETNGFNAKEKMRAMAIVREMASVDRK
jgi:hypothetical protein